MTYVDGYVLVVPEKNREAYVEMAEKAGKLWMEHGALDYKESIAEDMSAEEPCSNFYQTMQTQPGETVVFAYIVYQSCEHRDEVNAKVMVDPRFKELCDAETMPFDCKRMTYGGFQTIVEF